MSLLSHSATAVRGDDLDDDEEALFHDQHEVDRPLLSQHSHSHDSGTNVSSSSARKYILLLTLTAGLAIFTIAAAVVVNSLALLTDGLHTVGHLWLIGVGYYCDRAKSSPPTTRYSYGWQRMEVLGGLTNGLTLIALSIFIMLESIPRFIKPLTPLHRAAPLFVGVAAAEFLINVLGTILFCDGGRASSHGHSHSHSHSHGAASPSTSTSYASNKPKTSVYNDGRLYDANQWAVFLHFLVDCILSFVVLAIGLIVGYGGTAKWISYVDPVASLLMVAVILLTAVPLVIYCAKVVLQAAPPSIDLASLLHELSFLPHVQSVSQLHVWSLSSSTAVATVQLIVADGFFVPTALAQADQSEKSLVLHEIAQLKSLTKATLERYGVVASLSTVEIHIEQSLAGTDVKGQVLKTNEAVTLLGSS